MPDAQAAPAQPRPGCRAGVVTATTIALVDLSIGERVLSVDVERPFTLVHRLRERFDLTRIELAELQSRAPVIECDGGHGNQVVILCHHAGSL